MKLNSITQLHKRAPINGKDVNFDFILEELEQAYSMAHGKARHALYIGDTSVEIVNIPNTNVITIISKNTDVLDKVAHEIANPINSNRETDLYAEVFDSTMETHKCIRFYHTNTDVLECRYRFESNDGTQEGSFLLDMLSSDTYEGIHEGCPGIHEDWPDEYMFSKVIETGVGTSGFEVHVRLNANKADVEVTEAVVYLWKEYPDGHRENDDTIDAEIIIMNTDTCEVF